MTMLNEPILRYFLFSMYFNPNFSRSTNTASIKDGEKEEKTLLSDKKVFNQGINTLNFDVKNGLINLVINHQTHYKTEQSLAEMKKGAFGVVCDGNSKCLLFGCKLESI